MKYKTKNNNQYHDKDNKVENFILTQLDTTKNLKLMLIKIDTNIYVFYGKYILREENNHCTVEIESKKYRFGTLKTATTWCVFKERKMIVQCRDIEFIDTKISGLELELIQHSLLLQKAKNKEMIHIYNNKLHEGYYLKKVLLKNLNKYINTAKKWQIQKFDLAKNDNKR